MILALLIYVLLGIPLGIFVVYPLPMPRWQRAESAIGIAVAWPLIVAIILLAVGKRIVKGRCIMAGDTWRRDGKAYGLYNRLDFGKYYGRYVRDVIAEDSGYIAWCLDNVEGFQLTEEAMKEYEEAD